MSNLKLIPIALIWILHINFANSIPFHPRHRPHHHNQDSNDNFQPRYGSYDNNNRVSGEHFRRPHHRFRVNHFPQNDQTNYNSYNSPHQGHGQDPNHIRIHVHQHHTYRSPPQGESLHMKNKHFSQNTKIGSQTTPAPFHFPSFSKFGDDQYQRSDRNQNGLPSFNRYASMYDDQPPTQQQSQQQSQSFYPSNSHDRSYGPNPGDDMTGIPTIRIFMRIKPVSTFKTFYFPFYSGVDQTAPLEIDDLLKQNLDSDVEPMKHEKKIAPFEFKDFFKQNLENDMDQVKPFEVKHKHIHPKTSVSKFEDFFKPNFGPGLDEPVKDDKSQEQNPLKTFIAPVKFEEFFKSNFESNYNPFHKKQLPTNTVATPIKFTDLFKHDLETATESMKIKKEVPIIKTPAVEDAKSEMLSENSAEQLQALSELLSRTLIMNSLNLDQVNQNAIF